MFRSDVEAAPAAGYYPVPTRARHGDVAEREWDGDAWRDATRPAPEGTSLPGYRRHFFGFLRGSGWKLLLLFLVSTGIASALWRIDPDRGSISGGQLALPLFALLGAVAVMLALIALFDHRIRFAQIADRRAIVTWGIVAGVVGVGVALLLELGLPKLVGSDPDAAGWPALAGPAEEGGKLLVPILLWFSGRFRNPRQGLLLVLVSGATFGIIESTEYAFSPDKWEPARPFAEVMHPLFAGFTASVAWRHAWGRASWFTLAGVGAWLLAMAMHSVNDLCALDLRDVKATGAVTPLIILTAYLLLKHSSRQLVPPDMVGKVSRRWRPIPPRHALASSAAIGESGAPQTT
jgi:hypothetical protein